MEMFEIDRDGDVEMLCAFDDIYVSLDMDHFKRLKVLHWVKIPLDEFNASMDDLSGKTVSMWTSALGSCTLETKFFFAILPHPFVW